MIITLSFFSIGYLLTSLLRIKSKLERLGIGYLLAFGLTGIIFFGLLIMGVGLTPLNAYAIIALGIISLIVYARDLKQIRINRWWIAIFGVVILSFIINLYWPVSTWDSLTMYGFRAKFFSLGKLPADIKEITNYGYYLGNYPFMYSVVLALPYLINSSPTTLITGIFLSLILIFYSYVKKNRYAMPLTLLLSISSLLFVHSTYIYSNLPYSVFLIASAFLICKYLDNNEIKYLLLGLFMVIFGSWIRYAEPFHYSVFLVLIISLLSKRERISKIFLVGILIAITIIIRGLWNTYRIDFYKAGYPQPQTSNDLITYPVLSTLKIEAQKTSSLLKVMLNNFGKYTNYIYHATDEYRVLFLSCLFFFIANRSWKSIIKYPQNYFFTLFSITSIALFVVGIVIFSTQIPNMFEIPDSARRMLMFLLPSLLLSIHELTQEKL